MEMPDFETQLVAKVLVTDGEDVLLLRRSEADKHRPGGTDLPGGGVEDYERHDPRLAACRELDEEARIKAKPDELQLLRTESRIRPEERHGVVSPVLRVWSYYVLLRKTMPAVSLSREHGSYDVVPREIAPKHAEDYPRARRVLNDFNKLLDV